MALKKTHERILAAMVRKRLFLFVREISASIPAKPRLQGADIILDVFFLEKEGFLESRRARERGKERLQYRITKKGKAELKKSEPRKKTRAKTRPPARS